ncbi:VOC family protein [Microbulbifer thermotolerans]|uniref:Bleomycin resistance protein n=1 Tax=Microbulbifer thermotolerans TaxID=252514 RepID=A0A143HPG3_MICTH|nr:glyoxalase/bleomycin resistance/extradiol dioxygenase family protein [Microbulbifer thermotolerans]AMX03387.1 bleomycin resistance protein [Microbulbifer thermotolerans]MCX2781201.1 glyoxalase/bleomycin resistance/extradiol dioxygenase family protein [Microbulbifer thermotolerans]MCX2783015.1 glyoxalase/bleomycin resistance/extradiol dioxygenase family protein [Microbulbifer thermotolerans]MCX2795453.1 glyoxalase/bleomycin resistance/extradiol dioxygenase family protein [Microbulbifer thermo
MGQFLGLRTVIYGVTNIAEAKDWYSRLLEQEPYFDSECYVGFNVGGYELGLDPDARNVISRADGVVAYWGVRDIDAQVERINALGARQHSDIVDVGEGIRMATFLDPYGNIFGIIENPHFKAE